MNQSSYQSLSGQSPENILLDLPFYYVPTKSPTAGNEWAKWHEELEIKFIHSGKAEITCGTDVFLAQQGDVIVVNSCQLHSIRPSEDDPVVYDLLMVSPGALYAPSIGGLLASMHEDGVQIENLIRGDSTVTDLGKALFQGLKRKDIGFELEAIGLFALLMARLLRFHGHSGVGQKLPPDAEKYITRLRPAIAYIQQNYHKRFKEEMLAATCGLSVFHFCRLFRQVTGHTVIDYTNRFRCQKAKLLLASTELSVAEICDALGFSDPAYFSRCFSKVVGRSPRAFREAAK